MILAKEVAFFNYIKPFCIKLSNLLLQPSINFNKNSIQITNSLNELNSALNDSIDKFDLIEFNQNFLFFKNDKIPEYIFLPINFLLNFATNNDNDNNNNGNKDKNKINLLSIQIELILKILDFLFIYTNWNIYIPPSQNNNNSNHDNDNDNDSSKRADFFPLLLYLTFDLNNQSHSNNHNDDNINLIELEKSYDTKLAGLKTIQSYLITIDNYDTLILSQSQLNPDLNDSNNSSSLLFISSQKNLILSSNLISHLLSIIQFSTSNIQIQLASIHLLDFLFQSTFHKNPNHLFKILPGTISIFNKILSKNQILNNSNRTIKKFNSTVLIQILNIFSTLLTIVINDNDLNHILLSIENDANTNNQHNQESQSNETNKMKETKETNQINEINKSWLLYTSKQIKIVFLNISNSNLLKNNSKLLLKKALLSLYDNVIKNSVLSLIDSIPIIIISISYLCDINTINNENVIIDNQLISKGLELLSFIYNNNNPRVSNLITDSLSNSIDNLSNFLHKSDQDILSSYLNSTLFLIDIFNKNQIKKKNNQLQNLLKNSIITIKEELSSSIINQKILINQKNSTSKLKLLSSSTSFNSLSYSSSLSLISKYTPNLVQDEFSNLTLSKKESLYLDKLQNLHNEIENLFFFIFNKKTETSLSNLLVNIGKNENSLSIIENLLINSGISILDKSLTIYLASKILTGYNQFLNKTGNQDIQNYDNDNDIDQYLNFEEASDYSSIENVESNRQELVSFTLNILEVTKEIFEETSTIAPDFLLEIIHSISLNSIGTCCEILGESFKFELSDYLYPIIDGLASNSETIRNIAQQNCLLISKICYDYSVHNLIFENCDYLLDSVSIRLTSSTITPRTATVLMVLVKISGSEILPYLDDILNSMFVLLDMYHGYAVLCQGFFAVFDVILDAINEKYLKNYDFYGYFENLDKDLKKIQDPWGMKSISDLVSFVSFGKNDMSVEKQYGDLKDDGDDENDTDSDDESVDESVDGSMGEEDDQKNIERKWESSTPKSLYLLVSQICSYCIRLYQHPSINLKISILMILKKVIRILSTNFNELLPVLSSLWPFVSSSCIQNSDLRMKLNGLILFQEMIKYSGSFLSKQYLEFWESIKKSLYANDGNLNINYKNKNKNKTQMINKQVLIIPGISLKCQEILVEVLVSGIRGFGNLIESEKLQEIIEYCCHFIKNENEEYDAKFGNFSDLAWYNLNKKTLNENKQDFFESDLKLKLRSKIYSY
ncbi:Tti1p ASCRUDRAFT_155147 [Ascoidea rubescens DSM 1968]|uniref:TTI1 C-terminal TPR domain-containing protein n=1 Tax=Ascoidea rubescens DSM 1968 TaxID=1344418 RepID=A0A1D2VFY6_9ASCO|nr:hypothetical protein ASCRUDRAFT_155147 [Ascoidea rubescens DSM 1968]ODV60571.1 hypothetical protein ASCRUDRAFT_155147 [Ascoidea rubescens DSM 1968]